MLIRHEGCERVTGDAIVADQLDEREHVEMVKLATRTWRLFLADQGVDCGRRGVFESVHGQRLAQWWVQSLERP